MLLEIKTLLSRNFCDKDLLHFCFKSKNVVKTCLLIVMACKLTYSPFVNFVMVFHLRHSSSCSPLLQKKRFVKTGSCDRCSKGPHYWFFSRFCSSFQTKIIFPSPNLIGNQRTTALSIYFVHKISTTTTAIFIFLIFNYLKFVKLY